MHRGRVADNVQRGDDRDACRRAKWLACVGVKISHARGSLLTILDIVDATVTIDAFEKDQPRATFPL
jgi:hypothetical protein